MTYEELRAAGAHDMVSHIRHADGTVGLLVGVTPPGVYACASSVSAVAEQGHYTVMVDIGEGPRPVWDLADCEEVL